MVQEHQTVLRLDITAPVYKARRVKSTRSRNGCLNCRRAKKKCDERRPTCSGCELRAVECGWRDTVATAATTARFVHETQVGQALSHGRRSISREAAELEEPANKWLNRCEISFAPGYMLQVDQKQLFLNVCGTGFIAAVGPQYTHPLLTANATLGPMLQQNSIIEAVAESCGCSFLSWSTPELVDLSYVKFQAAIKALLDYTSTHRYEANALWIGVACQLLCTGAKITSRCMGSEGSTSLRLSYQFIKKRLNFERKQRVLGPHEKYRDLFQTNDVSLGAEIEHSLIGYQSRESSWETRSERLYLDSFIFNYSVSILCCQDIRELPDPFDVFELVKDYVKFPILQCEVVWMNSPVMGAAFEAFEIGAKASYLMRLRSPLLTTERALRLLETASFYPPPILSPEIRMNKPKYLLLRNSILIADITMRAAKVVLRKLLDPELQSHDHSLQQDLVYVVDVLQQIPRGSAVWAIASWSLFVMGLVAVDDAHRKVILDSLYTAAESIHKVCFTTTIDTLELSWGGGKSVSEVRGLDVLLDDALLQTVYL